MAQLESWTHYAFKINANGKEKKKRKEKIYIRPQFLVFSNLALTRTANVV